MIDDDVVLINKLLLFNNDEDLVSESREENGGTCCCRTWLWLPRGLEKELLLELEKVSGSALWLGVLLFGINIFVFGCFVLLVFLNVETKKDCYYFYFVNIK